MKIVVADPKGGRAYQVEIDETKGKALNGSKVGDEVDGSLVGLNGFKVQITGGSDKEGFPMRKGFHGNTRKKLLVSGGAGTRGAGMALKKTIRGEVVSEDISQINVKVVKYGDKGVADALGVTPKENKEEAKA